MKKILKPLALFSLLILCGINSNVFAQYLTVGPRAGIGVSNMPNIEANEKRVSPNIGVFAVYSNQSHWGISGEVLYAVEGARQVSSTVDRKISLHYVKVPVALNYFFGNYESKLRPKVYAGPYVSFLVDQDAYSETTGDEVTPIYNFSRVDAGVVVGAGINFEVATGVWVNTDLRYTRGLLDVYDSTPEFGRQMNQSFMAMVGVGFGL